MRALPSVREVLVRAHGELSPEVEGLARDALEAHARAETPWYLRLLVGMGAWIGSWFLLAFAFGFLALILSGAVEQAAVVMGAALVMAGVGLRRAGSGELVRQLSLVGSFTGQMMVIGGVGATSESVPASALTALVLCAILVVVFHDKVHRFASTVIATVALALLFWEVRLPFRSDILAIVLAAVPLVIWRFADPAWRQELAEMLDPIAYGAIVSLLVGLLVDAAIPLAGGLVDWRGPGLATVAAVTGALLWLTKDVFAEHGVGTGGPDVVLAGVALAVFAWLTRSTPALIATLLLIVLGFDRRRPLLMGLATAFFLGFGALYYYNLDMTLLAKSGVLVGSGLVCLGACAVIHFRAGRSGEPATKLDGPVGLGQTQETP
jgi:hypothetical protein